MPIKKRKSTKKLTDEQVVDAVNSCMTVLGYLLGDDISVSMVIQRDNDVNIITNETDYDKLTSALQSIVNNREKLAEL